MVASREWFSLSRILMYGRCRRWILFAITAGCIGTSMLIISLPSLGRRYAAEMMVQAVKADETELEGSFVLAAAIDRVAYFKAQDEAVACLIPLLDVKNYGLCLRARFCILYLNARSPTAVNALIAIYCNPLAPTRTRISTAGMLTSLAPHSAEECGAAAIWRQYADGYDDLHSECEVVRFAASLLHCEAIRAEAGTRGE